MKRMLLATLLVALLIPSASAASLSVDQVGNVFSLYLNGFGFDGNFNVVDVKLSPESPGLFVNVDSGFNSGVPRVAGEPFTFRNRLLDAAVVDGGEGWSMVGVVETPASLAFASSPLGRQIDTSGHPGGRIFLANVVLPAGTATANVDLVGNGQYLARLSTTFATGNVPEPSTSILLAVACAAGLASRCRANRRRE